MLHCIMAILIVNLVIVMAYNCYWLSKPFFHESLFTTALYSPHALLGFVAWDKRLEWDYLQTGVTLLAVEVTTVVIFFPVWLWPHMQSWLILALLECLIVRHDTGWGLGCSSWFGDDNRSNWTIHIVFCDWCCNISCADNDLAETTGVVPIWPHSLIYKELSVNEETLHSVSQFIERFKWIIWWRQIYQGRMVR